MNGKRYRKETLLGGDPALADHRGGRDPRPGLHRHDHRKHQPAEGTDNAPPRGEGGGLDLTSQMPR